MKIEKATFGAGCFWGVESAFRAVGGVISATSGYSGGTKEYPTYEDVCTGATGHAEVVEVEFDSDSVSYEDLLAEFWKIHDPTTPNRQGPDVGSQYRSAIFTHSPEQEKAAVESKNRLDDRDNYSNPIVTEITEASEFYRAEEYHQHYFEKHGIEYCPV
ncbi:MAG: peptide-methionine (S)-S-oxide reductase MsrA [Candidatus Marinimicrobia bacterium]|nr:peptide-methionine (S)-S-oxide reductase MsrA [Candidatus Neomarinimicrobiota bacterium]